MISVVSRVGSGKVLRRTMTALVLLNTPMLCKANELGIIGAPFGDCRLGYWSSNRNLDDRVGGFSNTCFATWKPQLNEQFSLGLNARSTLTDTRLNAPNQVRLREAFLGFEQGPWTIKLGRQILAWGRSDRIAPTDNLSPRGYTSLVTDDEEQRNGLLATQVRYHVNEALTVTGIAAHFEADKLPTGSLPSNLVSATTPNRTEYAIKVDRNGSGLDWSLSYFDGFHRSPRYQASISKLGVPNFFASYEKNQTLGGDIALPLGTWTLRGELAATRSTNQRPGCPAPSASRKVTKLVIGAERELSESISAAVQLFALRRNNYISPANQVPALLSLYDGLDRLNSEFAAREQGMTVRLGGRFMNDRLKLELSTVVHRPVDGNRSVVLRPRASFALNDHLKINFGTDQFLGETQSYFGSRRKNSIYFIELSVGLPI